MRAARFHTHGDPSVLRVEEVPWPTPRRDEVLIRVHGSSVSGTDTGVRSGKFGFPGANTLPMIPGFDVAGVVQACGPQVTSFRPGERVYALLGHGGGGAAEFVTVRQSRVGPAPASTDLVTASAVPLSGLTALQALRHCGELQARSSDPPRVLIHGASGGIGAFAVQLARMLGAHVTGVARAGKLDWVRELGADEVLSTENLRWDAGHEPWHLILDVPATLHLATVGGALREDGVLVSTQGFTTHLPDLRALPRRSRPRFANVRTAERGLDLAFLSRLMDAGDLRVPVDQVYPLEQIAAAHAHLEGGGLRGKVVVAVAGDAA